jgi:hypothetical protein
MRARRKIVYSHAMPVLSKLANRTISNVPLARLLILRDQASVTMRLCAGLSRAEFALLARPRATSRATDSLYLFESGLLGLDGSFMMGQSGEERWSILHSDIGWLCCCSGLRTPAPSAGEVELLATPTRGLGFR